MQTTATVQPATTTESIIYKGRIPFTAILLSYSGWFILIATLSGIGLPVLLLIAFIRSLQNHLEITDERIEYTHGLFTQVNETIELFRVKDSNFRQTFLQRIFGVGTVTIQSSDKSAPVISFPFRNPKSLVNDLRKAVNAQRDKRGYRIVENS